MTDKPRDSDASDTGYEPAPSPYDQPTEQLTPTTRSTPTPPASSADSGSSGSASSGSASSGSNSSGSNSSGSNSSGSDRMPRTEEDLDFGERGSGSYPTEQIPSFRPSKYDEPIAPDSRYGAGSHSEQPTEFIETPAAKTHRSGVAEVAAPVPEPITRTETVEIPARRGTTDLGLLLLRLAVGGIFLVHGLQKLIGLWNGPGLDGFRTLLEDSGYEQANLLAIAGAIGETAGGALLILGLATPFAGAAVLAVAINAWCFKQAAEPGLAFFAPDGVEYETLLGVAAAAIILTGPGKIALDGRRGWATRPRFGSFIALVVGIAGGVCLWIFLNGANPLVQ
ncbi:DoxX family protein [Rhodococcus sp. 1168]|uniref:DoxX family protein n=1 Tax=Rhodococcus sp. 1168 TaxID=2018041 RepID=UPI000A0D74F2|nr:DoxX family protein [Rhodococcus sp. 1168]ORI18276.1 DoxX family protein [Rhodococcus sp. 1168]